MPRTRSDFSTILRTATAVLLAVAILAPSLSHQAVTAAPLRSPGFQTDDELVEPGVYTSPQLGLTVEWSEPWIADERRTVSRSGAFDRLVLESEDHPSAILTLRFEITDVDPEALLADELVLLERQVDRVQASRVEETQRGFGVLVEFDDQGEPFRAMFEAIEIEPLVAAIFILESTVAEFEDALASVLATVTIDGETVFLTDDAVDESTPDVAPDLTPREATREARRAERTATIEGVGATATPDDEPTIDLTPTAAVEDVPVEVDETAIPDDRFERRTATAEARAAERTATAAADNDPIVATPTETIIDIEPTETPAERDPISDREAARTATAEARAERRTATPGADDDATPEPDASIATPGIGPLVPDEAGVAGNVYLSPTYGYTLTWDERVWSVNQQFTDSTDGVDSLTLDSRLSQLIIQSFVGFRGDAAFCFESVVDFLANNDGDFTIEDVEPLVDATGEVIAGEDADRAFGAFQYTSINNTTGRMFDVAFYTECRTLVPGDSVLVVIHFADLADYPAESERVAEVVATIDLDGGIPTTAERATEPPADGDPNEATPAIEGEYVSATYGFSLEYDPAIWRVTDEFSQGGNDVLRLSNGPSSLDFLAIRDFQGSALTCVNDTLTSIREEPGVTSAVLVREPGGNPITGGTDTEFFALYLIEVTGGTFDSTGSLNFYIECRTLVPGESVLLIQHIVQAENYGREEPLVRDVIDSIDL